MEEKKLADEEIIKALEDCYREYTDMNRHSCDTCPYREVEPCGKAQMTDCLDLIKRLQAENETLKSKKFGMWKVKFFKAQEEIERLTGYNENLNGMCLEFTDKNAELQKQVDELTERYLEESKERCEFEQKYKKIQHIHNIGLGTQRSQWEKKVEQAVNDTAKEILQSLIDKAYVNECIDLTVSEVKAWFREDYGVEVE